MYLIVLFNSEEVEVVPKSWVNGNKCFWPSHLRGASLTKAIENQLPPDSDWQVCQNTEVVREVGSNYRKARQKCRKVEEHITTDLDATDGENIVRKRLRPSKYRSDEEQEAEAAQDHQSDIKGKSFPLPRQPGHNDTSFTRPTTSRKPGGTQPRVTMSALHNALDADIDMPADPLERDRMIFSTLLQIKAMVRNNAVAIKKLSEQKRTSLSIESAGVDEFDLPMKTEQDVEKVNAMVRDTTHRKKLVSHLSTLGGFSAKEVINRIMGCLFTTNLAIQYNWSGKAPKLGLAKLTLATVILEAGKLNRLTESQMEAGIRLWLKNAGDRDGGRKMRAQRKADKDLIEEQQVMTRLLALIDSSDMSSEEEI